MTLSICTLLARAMYPSPARVQAELQAYRADPTRQVWAWEVGGHPVSAAGLRIEGGHATVLHIGTAPDHARRGHACALLHAVAGHLNLQILTAETDVSAADFYRRCGFTVQEVPSSWEGRRYRCEWVAATSS